MAKIWGIPHNRRAKKFKNHLVIKNTSLGGYVAASWPRKGWYDNSPAGRERAGIFGQVQSWTRRPHPLAQIDAIEGSEGTMYLPRDLLTKCAYGKLTEIHWRDGTVTYPVKLMSEEAQALLNSISITPGAILMRTASQWVGIDPGALGTVLTAQGAAGLPQWQPPQGSSGGFGWVSYDRSGNQSTSTTIHKGAAWESWSHVTVSAVAFHSASTTAERVKATICEMQDGTVAEILTDSNPVSFNGDGSKTVSIPLKKRVNLKPHTIYWIAISKLNNAGVDPFPMTRAPNTDSPAPFYSIAHRSYFTSEDITVGLTPETSINNGYYSAIGA